MYSLKFNIYKRLNNIQLVLPVHLTTMSILLKEMRCIYFDDSCMIYNTNID